MTAVPAETRFRRLYDDHHRAILAYFLRRLDRESAYEAAAEVFLVAWRRHDVVPDGEGALPWLYVVARRVLSNQRRGAARRRRLWARLAKEPRVPADHPEPIVVRRQEHADVIAALQRLSANDQELLRLAVWEELPHKQIAEVVGCSPGAVDVRLHRAVKRLAKGLARTGHRQGERQAFSVGEER